MTDIKVYEGLTTNQQLNLFRNLYYNDGNTTERGIIANVINDILPEYNRQKSEIERLKEEVLKARRKALLEAKGKFAGHSDYHGDTILCKLICMAEGKEVGVAQPLDTMKIKVEAVKEFAEAYKEQIKDYTGMFTDDGFYISLQAALSAVDFIKEKMTEG